MTGEPVGQLCPGCKKPPLMAFAEQAFCGSEDCRIVSWNPTLSIDENLDGLNIIDLGGFLEPDRSDPL